LICKQSAIKVFAVILAICISPYLIFLYIL